jgi:sterol desaturase/sphingolipid hydroxylase (fatty acid hydroxylase superfamily)
VNVAAMLEAIDLTVQFAKGYASQVFIAAAVIAALEYFLPRSNHSLASRFRGAMFRVVYIVITAVGLTLFQQFWVSLGIKPLFHLELSGLSNSGNSVVHILGGVAASLIVIQFLEFFYYWFHRLQHSNRFFWRFHAVHHSLEEMNAFNSVHHFSEELFRLPFVTIPLSLLFSFDQGYIPWLWGILLGAHGIYEHSTTRLNFGPLRYILPDNCYHRIHHSKDPRHFDKNFGSASALWDIVFGTAHFLLKDEWPETGLKDKTEAKTLRDYMLRPFIR